MDDYLGAHNSAESRRNYKLVAEWQARPVPAESIEEEVQNTPDLTVNELLLAYSDHARASFVKDGQPTRGATENQCLFVS
ncbi:hypothetical protein [Tautonia rosea]|uniref:hypothetical protein n=1 Tax=Tautonia rosea TaxID=2728037 RepID=UPI001472B98E|nr:hypothetical protein [Tautonia rosea]